MSGVASVVCLCSVLLLGHGEEKTVHKARQSGFEKNRDPNPPPRPKGRPAVIKVMRTSIRHPADGVMLEMRQLLYHHTNIGVQFEPPSVAEDRGKPAVDYSRLPTTYYHPKGPAGCVLGLLDPFPANLNTYHADARLPASLIALGGQPYTQLLSLWSAPPVAVLGLEVGTPAAYARPFQTIHFTEREPAIRELSQPSDDGAPTFHYVRDARDRGANVQVFAGEPRPTFAKHGGARFYRVILVELYKGDLRNLHEDLLTREGMAMLLGKLRDDGILCYHVSHRYYNLEPIVAAAAKALGLACVLGHDGADWRDEPGHFTSSWVMVAQEGAVAAAQGAGRLREGAIPE